MDIDTDARIGRVLYEKKSGEELFKVAVGLYGLYQKSDGKDRESGRMATEVAIAAFFEGYTRAGYLAAEALRNGTICTSKMPKRMVRAVLAYYEAAGDEVASAALYIAKAYAGRFNDLDSEYIHPNNYLASVWYEKSASKGNAEAQFDLGCQYWKGRGVAIDADKMYNWWLKSANQGYMQAQLNLGLLFNGDLEERPTNKYYDFNMAGHWLFKAAKNGSKDARAVLEHDNFRYNESTDRWSRDF